MYKMVDIDGKEYYSNLIGVYSYIRSHKISTLQSIFRMIDYSWVDAWDEFFIDRR